MPARFAFIQDVKFNEYRPVMEKNKDMLTVHMEHVRTGERLPNAMVRVYTSRPLDLYGCLAAVITDGDRGYVGQAELLLADAEVPDDVLRVIALDAPAFYLETPVAR